MGMIARKAWARALVWVLALIYTAQWGYSIYLAAATGYFQQSLLGVGILSLLPGTVYLLMAGYCCYSASQRDASGLFIPDAEATTDHYGKAAPDMRLRSIQWAGNRSLAESFPPATVESGSTSNSKVSDTAPPSRDLLLRATCVGDADTSRESDSA